MPAVATARVAKLVAPKGFCRGCGQPVPKGRFTWCSDACVERNRIKIDPGHARRLVEKRDHGVCAVCGMDTDKCERILWRLRCDYRTVSSTVHTASIDAFELLLNLWAPRKRPHQCYGWDIPHLWEADHVVPVCEGGGACELDNYRTLCIACHRAETKELARRRAAEKKGRAA